jgi:adenylate cyclase
MQDRPTSKQDFASPAQRARLRFGQFVLDLGLGSLLRDGQEIPLRPKTFAILRHLVENPSRLVSKDELFDAVWPNVTVTDDALVQSIGELRRALGDDGLNLIKTVPRRGYRFAAAVTDDGPADRPPAAVSAISDAAESAEGQTALVPPGIPASRSSRIAVFASLAIAVLFAGGVLLWTGEASRLAASLGLAGRPADAGAGAKPTIAILPLADQSDDPARAYLADGMTQDIINALGRFSSLTVMSWNAVVPYKGKPASPDGIRDLGVGYLVEGSVRQTGERMRQRTGRVLWSARFDEALTNLFALQDRITREITGALAIRVTDAEARRTFAKPTENLEAYDYVLRARPALQRPERTSLVEARSLLLRAIELDSSYAAARAALGETYYSAVSMGWAESPTASLDQAEELAHKALALDDSNVRARIILSRVHVFYQRYDQAKAEIDRALAINPNDASGIAGRGNILMWLGQTDAAIEDLELAQRIDPDLVPMDRFALSLAYYLNGRYDSAIEQAELNLRRSAGANFSRIVLAAAYAQQNRTADVERVVSIVRRADPTFEPQEFGTKFLSSGNLEHLGPAGAGLPKT